MLKANVFNIQKFSVHDGPGIRTTIFFKGCPLSCIWCHNPESISFKRELLYNSEKCGLCGRCGEIWKTPVTDADEKTEAAVDKCISGAIEIAGKFYTVSELLKEIEKDRTFYEQSGGGVTFSGGEALCRIDFVEALAKACKERDISVAVDTCGHVPFESFKRILEYTDIFLYDIKIMDENIHKKYTGTDNSLIIENLEKLSEKGASIWLRLPLIEGINTDAGHIEPLVELVKRIRVAGINLLPYHDIARGKYARLGGSYQKELMSAPSKERLEEIKGRLEPYCGNIRIGG